MKRSFMLYAVILLVLMNIFLPIAFILRSAYEQNKYEKQLKIKESLNLANKLNDANYFLEK
jgi:hypothetical protein